jgi:osmoprotectant transport system ATP-binding protein
MIALRRVSKRYPNGLRAVDDLSMEVAEGETLVLLGTSGSGKTTTMKMINRLIESTSGEILIDGQNIKHQNPTRLRRKIGYAIQHVSLFPHMTVAENIAVVPKLLNWPAGKISNRVERLLAMVGLPAQDFRDRFPAQLSGGQKQRIGVARALAADPPVVLMDEPFGALDPITREKLQNEFIELETEIKKTIIFVTHDVFEAVKMGDRIALLNEGVLQQLARPVEIVENPANEFVHQFLGRRRFQLSLLTHKVESIMEKQEAAQERAGKPEVFLKVTSSLLDALDMFKETKKKEIEVYRKDKFYGILRKQHLLDNITKTLEEMGQEQ